MNAIATKTTYTPEELLALPDEKDYELVDGHLVERKTSLLSSWVAGSLLAQIRGHGRPGTDGWVFPGSMGYRCFPKAPDRVRRADVSFITRERFSEKDWSDPFSPYPPDLAVEVISPKDLAWEIDQKVAEWLGAGVPLVWVVHPEARAVRIHRRNGPVTWLGAEDEISGEDLIPGFRCRVASIFREQNTPSAEGPTTEP